MKASEAEAVQEEILQLVLQTTTLLVDSTKQNVIKEASCSFPAFFSCYDWHSSVHSHWQVLKATNIFPENSKLSNRVANIIHNHLTDQHIEVELRSIKNMQHGFEMPYGMAWALYLCAELKEQGLFHALKAMKPLQTYTTSLFANFCESNPPPVRNGSHNQTAFSLSLALSALDRLEVPQLVCEIEKYHSTIFKPACDMLPIPILWYRTGSLHLFFLLTIPFNMKLHHNYKKM